MGHANLATTALYLHVAVERLAPTVERLSVGIKPLEGTD
jgi:hypothetical protein